MQQTTEKTNRISREQQARITVLQAEVIQAQQQIDDTRRSLHEHICHKEAIANESNNLRKENALPLTRITDQVGQNQPAGVNTPCMRTCKDEPTDDAEKPSSEPLSKGFNSLIFDQYRNEIVQQERVIEAKDAKIRFLLDTEARLQSEILWLRRQYQSAPHIGPSHQTNVVHGFETVKEEENVPEQAVSATLGQIPMNHDGARNGAAISKKDKKRAYRKARRLKQRERAREQRMAGNS